jgi:hypothetical protein
MPSQVIVTSHLFPEGSFSLGRLEALSSLVGKERLVVDVRYRGLLLARWAAHVTVSL